MIKILLCIIVILIILLIIVFSILFCKNSELKRVKENLEMMISANNRLHFEIVRLNRVNKIKSDNERETNEKIDDLHSGKLSADDVLPKCQG